MSNLTEKQNPNIFFSETLLNTVQNIYKLRDKIFFEPLNPTSLLQFKQEYFRSQSTLRIEVLRLLKKRFPSENFKILSNSGSELYVKTEETTLLNWKISYEVVVLRDPTKHSSRHLEGKLEKLANHIEKEVGIKTTFKLKTSLR